MRKYQLQNDWEREYTLLLGATSPVSSFSITTSLSLRKFTLNHDVDPNSTIGFSFNPVMISWTSFIALSINVLASNTTLSRFSRASKNDGLYSTFLFPAKIGWQLICPCFTVPLLVTFPDTVLQYLLGMGRSKVT